ncbi:MAG: SufD family Fe-S cluster assembly protein [Candidatus Gottesmanbacteria bacterium]|nr:SufD family Fe-S cluster assembly protein [Candidatus Gottesmanbacteria bacterium]
MNIQILQNTTKTIIQEIHGGKAVYEYTVTERAQLALLFVVAQKVDVEIVVRVCLTGRGARARIIGLVAGRGSQIIRIHTEQIHEAPDTTSNLLVKAALYDQVQFSYDGVIRVEPLAQKTDAYQKNENLLLSPHAHARSDPVLEILANDVRCTHGSTTGKPSEDQLWYLMSRGITRSTATQLLIEGFFERAIMTISDTIHQEQIRKSLWQII